MTTVGPAAITLLEKRLVTAGLLAYFVFALIVCLRSAGTYDAGDSVMHYMIARWAFVHPEHFLSHWGKPFFTLIASPFAQLGFGGMKLLQCLLALGCGWLLWRSAHRLQLKPAWLAPVFAFAAPEYFLAQTSGLTEPLFAFVLLLGVYLFLNDRPYAAAILLSLLPFVRTEGFLLLPVFGLYLLLQGNWKPMLCLAAGTLWYMVVGGIAKANFLWIWTENPYSSPTVPYGVGGLMHFPEQYPYVVGIPIFVLTILGLVLSPIGRRLQTGVPLRPLFWLVVAPFAVFFGAHVYFWVSGVGHSMGMIRVMISIVPLGALIALAGLQHLRALLQLLTKTKMIGSALGLFAAVYVIIFPIAPNPAAIHAADLELSVDQHMLKTAIQWTQANGMADRPLCSAHPSAGFLADKDLWDAYQFIPLISLHQTAPPKGTLILIDSWFGRVEAGFEMADFEGKPLEYKRLKTWEGSERNTAIILTLYEKI